MIAFDTNVWARAILGDDRKQSTAARASIEAASGEGGVFLPLLVLVELSWVLKNAPGWDAARTLGALRRLLDTEGVEVETAPLARQALELSTGAVGLADNLAALIVQARGCSRFLTFDAGLARTGRAELLK
jgi:predicted nucleic-acid-binding protein